MTKVRLDGRSVSSIQNQWSRCLTVMKASSGSFGPEFTING